jgi:tRNA A-37 threonylcarbamoyl transferase component Bud32/tetratricopeptide (TPR) repeat protein
MTPERWAELERLFVEAVEGSNEARAALVTETAARDPALAQELVRLLEADTTAARWDDLAGGGDPEAVGGYRILRRVGEGGMGIVYLAERVGEAVSVRVAVKVVRAGWSDQRMRRRFRGEQRILARLEHPHIARLLDGGTAVDARPYFVMEYVEGTPITAYCRDRGVPLWERVALFERVCAAVHFAHQNAVIHRDLKPSNVLVDRRGDPKLLDFGVAKLLSVDEGEPPLTSPTRPSGLTPEYASPEQIRGEALTTASDVYSLGVLLWELLTDAPLVAPGTGAAGHLALHADGLRAPSRVPGKAESWRRALRGDLDTIVAKALHADQRRRYGSALALAEDLERRRAHLPIAARPDSRWYRLSKLVRRNRLATIAVGLAFTVLVGASVSMAWQQAALVRERDASRAVQALLVDLFHGADRTRWNEDALSLDALLARGRQRIEGRFLEQPEIRVELLRTLAEVHMRLSQDAEAVVLMEEVLELEGRLLSSDDPQHLRSQMWLAYLRCRTQGVAAAEGLYLEAITHARERLGPNDPLLGSVFNARGGCHALWGRISEAEPDLREAYRIRRVQAARLAPALSQSLLNLGEVESIHGHLEEARWLLEAALGLRRVASVQADEFSVAVPLARVLSAMDETSSAYLLLEEVVPLCRDLLGESHPLTLAARTEFALVLQRIGAMARADEHIEAAQAALSVRRQWLVAEYVRAMVVAAEIALERGDSTRGEALGRAALHFARAEDYGDPEVTNQLVEVVARAILANGEPIVARDLLAGAPSSAPGSLAAAREDLAWAEVLRRQGARGACVMEARAGEAGLTRWLGEAHRGAVGARALLDRCSALE